MQSIPAFIQRCDRYCEAAHVTRTWLSKRLLKDTFRLQQLAEGHVDIGVKRLERASRDLTALERERASKAPSQDAA
jgi:hypothetical protein